MNLGDEILVSGKRCTKRHYIRPWKRGDKRTGMTQQVGKIPTPSYVLICNNQQVGAMDGSVGLIAALVVFEPYRGVKHSEIFLELIERVAKTKGVKRIETTSVSPPEMINALKRCGFTEGEDDCYYKDL